MAEIAAELHSHIADVAAAAPPLVIHVQKGGTRPLCKLLYSDLQHCAVSSLEVLRCSHMLQADLPEVSSRAAISKSHRLILRCGCACAGKDLLPQKTGRRLKELIQRLT